MQPMDNTLLETDLIQTFVMISETQSFTTAAKRIFRSPSAVSMQMKRLEEQLGRPLFVRHPRHVTLTPDGEAFLIHGREMLRINREALSRFRVPQLEGRVRFGAPDDFGTRLLPQILSRFASTHPLVDVDVTLSTTVNLSQQLEDGNIDLALVVTTQSDVAVGKLIHSEPLVWIGAKNGTAHTFTPTPLALSVPGCPWRASAISSLDEADITYRIAYTSETGAGQLAAVEADLAIAPLPVSLVTPNFGNLSRENGLPQIGAYQLRLHQTPNPSSASRAFSEHVCESFEHLRAQLN